MIASLLLSIVVSIIAGVALIAFLLRIGQRRGHARLNAEGFQELEVMVKGYYVPEVVEVKRGIPVRLHFRREEDTPCSEQVIFSDFHPGYRLPAYQTTLVSFIPTRCGDFMFTCAYGMYQGRLVVVEPTRRDLRKVSGSRPQPLGEGLPGLAENSTPSLGFVSGKRGSDEREQDAQVEAQSEAKASP